MATEKEDRSRHARLSPLQRRCAAGGLDVEAPRLDRRFKTSAVIRSFQTMMVEAGIESISGAGRVDDFDLAAGRAGLAAARERLHRFVEEGGHLVTLYHRPSDGWDPTRTPPRAIEIGSPSLRWRVTDPAAPIEILRPAHPLLAGPNRIGPADWQGWNKERGLYFASSWDKAYEPLVAMSDRGEAPLLGGLISGVIGRGRHTHVSLVLHHQLDCLVPGAFRLLANLVQPV